MRNLREAIKSLIAMGDNRKLIEDFARKKFNESCDIWDKNQKMSRDRTYRSQNARVGFCYFDGFVILSENKIRINYKYGFGGTEQEGQFVIDITEDVRDSSIDEIINDTNV